MAGTLEADAGTRVRPAAATQQRRTSIAAPSTCTFDAPSR